MRVSLCVSIVVLGLAVSCSSPPTSRPPGVADPDAPMPDRVTCVDLDGDGFGADCAPGYDCDDEDPLVHAGCITCGERPQEGCDCADEEPVECHSPAPELDEHGRLRCQVGRRTCADGAWTGCTYEDAYFVDNPAGGMRSVHGDAIPCPNCDPQCLQVGGDFESADLTPENSAGVRWDDVAGGIVLGGRTTNAQYAYIAMPGGSGTVAKIRTSDGAEVSRYYVGERNGLPNTPSRTAIDAFGNAYVANRGINGDWWGNDRTSNWGTITKMAGDQHFCIDSNGNRVIDTSNSSIPLAAGTDECVLWTVRIGNVSGSHPRALTIDRGDDDAPEGYVWVGTTRDKDNLAHTHGGRAYQLDPADGSVVQSIQLPLSAYGAVADSQNPQRVWFTTIFNGHLAAVNTQTGAVEGPFDPNDPGGYTDSAYGIAYDGRRIWQAGWSHRRARGYDPVTGTYCLVDPNAAGNTTGITARLNDDGSKTVYMAHATNPGSLSYWDPDVACAAATTRAYYCTNWTEDGCSSTRRERRSENWYPRAQIHSIALPRGYNQTWGVGPDANGRIWAVNQDSDNIAVYDPEDGSIVGYPSTAARLTAAYTYSDFTGYLRAVFTNDEGTYTQEYGTTAPVCPIHQDVTWGDVTFDATTPPGSRIVWEARTAGAPEDLPFARNVVLGEAPTDPSPIYIDDELVRAGVFNHHRYLRITARLISDDNVTSPILAGMTVDWVCIDRS